MRAAATLAALLLAGCEEHGKSPDAGPPDAPFSSPDAPTVDAFGTVGNPGFVMPNQPVAAWTETSPGTFVSATLDLSCLGVARVDPPLGSAAMLTATVRDFQSGNTVPGASIAAFDKANPSSLLDTATADGSGVAMLTIAPGTTRFGYRVEGTNSRPTFTFEQLLPRSGAQAVTVTSLSSATVQTLPALVGVSTSPTSALVLGTITDCQGHLLSNAIATVSGLTGMAMHLPGADTYYFSESVGLPVRHTQQAATSRNGQFMVIELPPRTNAVVQVWGFRSAADLPANLVILAELIVPLASGSAAITRHDPRATR